MNRLRIHYTVAALFFLVINAVRAGDATVAPQLPDVDQLIPDHFELWRETQFQVNQVELTGNSVLPAELIDRLTGPYKGKTIDTRELQELRLTLSKAYFAAGFVNSGVQIPDQSLEDGTLRLEAVEGKLIHANVKTQGRLSSRFVAARIERHVDEPLNINQVRAAIQMLQQDERIASLSADLVPGDRPGDAILRVDVKEGKRWSFVMGGDNHQAQSLGGERITLSMGTNNLTGPGDRVSIDSSSSRGGESYAVSYRYPLADYRLYTTLGHSSSVGSVLEAPFDSLDIGSKTETTSLSVDWPIQESPGREWSVSAGVEAKKSVSSLLGRRYSLSPGAQLGESRVGVLQLGMHWLDRSPDRVFAAQMTFRRGMPWFDATDRRRNPAATIAADGDFSSYLFQLQYLRSFNTTTRLSIRLTHQLALDSLLSLEKASLGGAKSLRGVRNNFLVRDNLIQLNLEVPLQLFQWGEQKIHLTPFLDYGRVWDEEDTQLTSTVSNTNEHRFVVSAGLSLDWSIARVLEMNLTWGDAFSDNFNIGEDPRESITDQGLQDRGFYFNLGFRHRF